MPCSPSLFINKLVHQITIRIPTDLEEHERKILRQEEEDLLDDTEMDLKRRLGVIYYNYAGRAIVSSLGELYKNARDAKASYMEISIYQTLEQCRVEVKDDGNGFPQEILELASGSSAFIPYASTKCMRHTTGGSGLGLYYLQLILRGSKTGTVSLDNLPEKGSCITVTAGLEPAVYGLKEIIEFRSEKGRIPEHPQELIDTLPPPAAPNSPMR